VCHTRAFAGYDRLGEEAGRTVLQGLRGLGEIDDDTLFAGVAAAQSR
jgi:hypothetical protein